MFDLNVLISIYVLVTSFIIVYSRNMKNKKSDCYLVINCVIILWELVPLLTSIHSDILRILYDWSPLIFLPILHSETELLTAAFNKVPYDEQVMRFDNKYFPYVMSFHQNNRINFLPFSEFLHLCYLSFYLIIYAVPLFFYLRQDFVAFYEFEFVIFLLLFSCFLTHSIIPVCGPRNIVEKINDHRSQGFFFRVTHKVLEIGSTTGTAFPSGHTGVATVALLMTWHMQSPIFYYMLPFGIGLIMSTIYGRFHYFIDMIFGFLYAIIAFFLTVFFYG